MELIAAIPLIGGFLSTVIPFLVVLGIVVFVHEYGHYIVGRWCGIDAEVFSVGYGKPLKQWTDKRGTVWQIAMLPLGGYVKFVGDMNAASFDDGSMAGMSGEEQARSFPAASVWRRALTVLAGPVANFILSTVVFAGLITYNGMATDVPTIDEFRIPVEAPYTVRSGDEILAVNGGAVTSFAEIYDAMDDLDPDADITLTVMRDGERMDVLSPYLLPPLVSGVQPLSPASRAGVKQDDLILTLGGEKLTSFDGLREVVLASEGVSLPVTVLRAGEIVELEITPQITDTPTADGGFEKRVMIGVAGSLAFEPATITPTPWTALWRGFVQVGDVIVTSLNGLKHIIIGTLGADNLQGPIGIAQISGESASQGFLNFIGLVALISTAIGMLNLFPIPILDGGHLVIYAYEAIAGRPPHPKVLNLAMSVGFVLLVALMLFATYNDIMRI
jgi:regulator of sigma E protease